MWPLKITLEKSIVNVLTRDDRLFMSLGRPCYTAIKKKTINLIRIHVWQLGIDKRLPAQCHTMPLPAGPGGWPAWPPAPVRGEHYEVFGRLAHFLLDLVT